MKTVVIIPARLNSTRLPKKVLLELNEKTIIQRVYEQCLKATFIDGVYIATDSHEIKTICEQFTKNIIMTDKSHQSGTDRIAEAAEKIECDFVINVQGDEPFIQPDVIDKLAQAAIEKNEDMVSVMHKINTLEDLRNPNVVKVVVDQHHNALYFSRSVLPFPRDDYVKELNNSTSLVEKYSFYRHLGIYAYKKTFLLKYAKMQPSTLEKIEKLEQLRVIENGYKIKMLISTKAITGIDTIEDYKRVKQLLDEIKK